MVSAASLLLLVFISGCAKESVPEQQRADQVLSQARNTYEQHQYSEARQQLLEALALDMGLRRPRQLAEETELLGRIAYAFGNMDSTLLYYFQSIEHYKAAGNKPAARDLTLEVSRIYQRTGEVMRAHEYLTESLRLARLFKEADAVTAIQWELAETCGMLEYTEEETAILNELLNAGQNAAMQARAQFALARSAQRRGDFTAAESGFLRVLTLAQQSRDSLMIINALSRLAQGYHAAGNTQKAFEHYTDALTLSDRVSNAQAVRLEMLMRVGNIYLQSGNRMEAGRFYRAALPSAIAMGNKRAEGYLFVQLGHCETDKAAASTNFQSALELFKGVQYDRGVSYAQRSMGAMLLRSRQFNDALQMFRSSADLDQQCYAPFGPDDVLPECESAAPDAATAFGSTIDLLLQLGRADEAFAYAQRQQNRELFDRLIVQEVRSKDTLVTRLVAGIRSALAQRIGAERRLEEILASGLLEQPVFKEVAGMLTSTRSGFDRVATEAMQRVPSLAPLAQAGDLSVDEVRAALPRETAFVFPLPTLSATHVIVVSQSGISASVASVKGKLVSAWAGEYSNMLQLRATLEDSSKFQQRRVEDRIDELGANLFTVLVRPVEYKLGGVTKLSVALPATLSGLPMHALRRGRSGRFVAEQFLIRYLPSVAMLRSESSRPGIPLRIAGAGHPGTTSWDVEYELRDIRAFYKDAVLRFSQQAEFNNLRSLSADVFHASLELRSNARVPSTAVMFWSDGQSPHGTRAIPWGSTLGLPSFPTVVLSNLGSPVVGMNATLGALFLMNRSGNVIVTSYTPHRRSKKYFGETVYTALLRGASTEMAHWAMQKEMIRSRDYGQPHVWAPYMLWGRGE